MNNRNKTLQNNKTNFTIIVKPNKTKNVYIPKTNINNITNKKNDHNEIKINSNIITNKKIHTHNENKTNHYKENIDSLYDEFNNLTKNIIEIKRNSCESENKINTLYKNNISINDKFNIMHDNIKLLNKQITNISINQCNLTILDIDIESLNFVNCINCITNGSLKQITKIYKINDLKILSNIGSIKIDGLGDMNNYDVSGDIFIYGLDTNVMYSGLIYKENLCIKYILANRPLVPINISMNCILRININIFITM
jgi:hypothetical protein